MTLIAKAVNNLKKHKHCIFQSEVQHCSFTQKWLKIMCFQCLRMAWFALNAASHKLFSSGDLKRVFGNTICANHLHKLVMQNAFNWLSTKEKFLRAPCPFPSRYCTSFMILCLKMKKLSHRY